MNSFGQRPYGPPWIETTQGSGPSARLLPGGQIRMPSSPTPARSQVRTSCGPSVMSSRTVCSSRRARDRCHHAGRRDRRAVLGYWRSPTTVSSLTERPLTSPAMWLTTVCSCVDGSMRWNSDSTPLAIMASSSSRPLARVTPAKQYGASLLIHSGPDEPSVSTTQSWLEPTGLSPLWPVKYNRRPSRLQTIDPDQNPAQR